MADRIRPYVAPVYLFLCLLLGGSAQGVWGNMILRLLALGIIAWALIERRDEPWPRSIRQLLVIVGAVVLLALLQMVPLPLSLWSALPGRELIVEGYRLLGVGPSSMSWSLAPYDTLEALLALLPALGMLIAVATFRSYSRAWLAVAMIVGTFAGVLLGALQVSSADPTTSPWYLYRQSNFGVATGFFANGNHMASLLLVTIPFIAALGATIRERPGDVRKRSAGLALVIGGLIVVVLGIALNGSLAGYGLGLPVLLASALLLFGAGDRFARRAIAGVALVSLASLVFLWTSPVSRGDQLGAGVSLSTRQTILANSVELAGRFGLVGTGLGTFAKAYPLTEDPAEVGRVFINHAHNDYVELAIETGLPGMLLILLFLGWWGVTVAKMVRSPAADPYAYAGAIASAALLLHSLVDYPLRTAALSAVFALCLALIATSRRTARKEGDLRPTRHLVVG